MKIILPLLLALFALVSSLAFADTALVLSCARTLKAAGGLADDQIATACAGAKNVDAIVGCVKSFRASGWAPRDAAILCARSDDIMKVTTCVNAFQSGHTKSEVAVLCSGTQDPSAVSACVTQYTKKGWAAGDTNQLCGGIVNQATTDGCVAGFTQAGGWASNIIADVCARATDLTAIFACFDAVIALDTPLILPELACAGAKDASASLACLKTLSNNHWTNFNASVGCAQ
jgi:hypothetical protein